MNSLLARDIEIIGFNGLPLVDCGRALPVVRRKHDGAVCVLDLSRGSDSIGWHNPDEAAEFLKSKRWTALSKPPAIPKSCVDGSLGTIATQPIVVFENEDLLDTAERIPRPDHLDGEYLMWQPLGEAYPKYFAAVASGDAIEAMLNDWSTGLLNRFDAMIGLGRDRADLKRIADFALCAACDRLLRWKAYLRYAATQEVDNVPRTFDRFIRPEFPKVSWEAFVEELKKLRDVWGAQPVFQNELQPRPTESIASKVKGIAQATSPRLVRND